MLARLDRLAAASPAVVTSSASSPTHTLGCVAMKRGHPGQRVVQHTAGQRNSVAWSLLLTAASHRLAGHFDDLACAEAVTESSASAKVEAPIIAGSKTTQERGIDRCVYADFSWTNSLYPDDFLGLESAVYAPYEFLSPRADPCCKLDPMPH